MEIYEEETDIINIVKTLRKVKKVLKLDKSTIDKQTCQLKEGENDDVIVDDG